MYTRWGKTTCLSINGTQLVYAGRAAGSWFYHKGGASNYLCLPNDPSYLQYRSQHFVIIYMGLSMRPEMDYCQHLMIRMYRVPCVIFPPGGQCWWYLQRPSALPLGPVSTTATCMMTERYNHHRSMFECVDQNPETVPGGACWRSRWSSIPPRGSNLHWDCMPSIHSWERTGLCSVYQVNL